MDPFVGEIRIFAGKFAPKGWAFCDGAILPITQNTALFSILGATYGGDGRTTFALPDLRGKAPVHSGQGPGLSTYTLGQSGGSSTVTLLQTEMPSHTHQPVAASTANETNASNTIWGSTQSIRGGLSLYAASSNLVAMHPNAIVPNGGGQPHNNMQPYLGINFIIALEGIYPPRS